MQDTSGNNIRETFLRFFESKGHTRVHSSSLVPHNDPTLLFTNAGMNQFKDVFLGLETRAYTRATTSQKCVRAGGKHNDLENVGFTRRHHTFFEMLGNFSFGDYFKREAIAYAWELCTSPEWFAIDKSKLYVTIFEGDEKVPRDDEAEQFWIEAGVPKERIFGMSAKDNFWAMGDTGPCGPCSEIYYDMGVAASETGEDLPFPLDEARYVEIWNLVFMQFDRAPGGELRALPKPSIDTGAGLERVASVLQGVLSNFETDLFRPLLWRAAQLTNYQGAAEMLIHKTNVSAYSAIYRSKEYVSNSSLRIIADHSRAATFLIKDGVLPSNEGRGYVLRKIVRRAIRHGRLLGQIQPIFDQMVFAVATEMSGAYPELGPAAERISTVILSEEKQFARVLEFGSDQLNLVIRGLKTLAYSEEISKFASDRQQTVLELEAQSLIRQMLNGRLQEQLSTASSIFPVAKFGMDSHELVDRLRELGIVLKGEKVFSLYETFGLPVDFIEDAARDAGVVFDIAGFEEARAAEQQRARASWKGGSKQTASPAFRELAKTKFEGYNHLVTEDAEILAIVQNGTGTQQIAAGESGEIVLDHTSFYADSGGQVGDIGWLKSADGSTTLAEVSGATKPVQGVFAHKVVAKQPLAVGLKLTTVVDGAYREATTRNHTGTHLLHAALREILGTHVKQAGSSVDPQRLRFDFSHFQQVADEELQDIEDLANREVLRNTRVDVIEDVPIDVAVNELHAMALFGEKYGDRVRVVKIGDFSTELCGGTHTGATGEIGLVKLIGENSVSSGLRRLEAVSGMGSLKEFRRDFDVARAAEHFAGRAADGASPAESFRARIAAQEDELKRLRRELEEARMKSASASLASAADNAVEVKGIKVLAQRVPALDRGAMRTLVDNLRNKLGSGVVVLGSATEDGRVALIAGVTKDLTGRIQAGKLVGAIAKLVDGSGGGKPDIAEAGGKNPAQLDAALQAVADQVGSLLG